MSTDIENTLDKIQYPIMTKAIIELGVEGKLLQLDQMHLQTPRANNVRNGERLKARMSILILLI